MADNLDAFLPNVVTQDTRKRLQAHGELVSYLRDLSNSTNCDEIDRIIDGLTSWINSSNYKVCMFTMTCPLCVRKVVEGHCHCHSCTEMRK